MLEPSSLLEILLEAFVMRLTCCVQVDSVDIKSTSSLHLHISSDKHSNIEQKLTEPYTPLTLLAKRALHVRGAMNTYINNTLCTLLCVQLSSTSMLHTVISCCLGPLFHFATCHGTEHLLHALPMLCNKFIYTIASFFVVYIHIFFF